MTDHAYASAAFEEATGCAICNAELHRKSAQRAGVREAFALHKMQARRGEA